MIGISRVRRIRNKKSDVSNGFNIRRERPKRRRELVGAKRTVTLKSPIFEVSKTNYYRFVKERKS